MLTGPPPKFHGTRDALGKAPAETFVDSPACGVAEGFMDSDSSQPPAALGILGRDGRLVLTHAVP